MNQGKMTVLKEMFKGHGTSIKYINLKLKEHCTTLRSNTQTMKNLLEMAEYNVDIYTHHDKEIRDINFKNKNITLEFDMADE